MSHQRTRAPGNGPPINLIASLFILAVLSAGSLNAQEKADNPPRDQIVFRLGSPVAQPGPDLDPAIAAVTVSDKKLQRLTPSLPEEWVPNGPTIRLSPDGKTVAYLTAHKVTPGGSPTFAPFVRPVADAVGWGRSLDVKEVFVIVAWSPKGDQLLVRALSDGDVTWRHLVVNVATKKTTPLKLPEAERPVGAEWFAGNQVTDWSRDGEWFLTQCGWGKDKKSHYEMYLVKSDGSTARKLKHIEYGHDGQFSPDGKRVLYVGRHVEDGKETYQRYVADLEGGKPVRISQELSGRTPSYGHCWSPDGKRIAYVWENGKRPEDNESFLMLVDADGRNPQVLFSQKSANPGCIGSPSWR